MKYAVEVYDLKDERNSKLLCDTFYVNPIGKLPEKLTVYIHLNNQINTDFFNRWKIIARSLTSIEQVLYGNK